MQSWLDSLDEHALVLTGSAALAAELRDRHAKAQIARGLSTWRSPDIMPLASWITRLWREQVQFAAEQPALLLGGDHERILWEQCIEADTRGGDRSVLHARGAAQQAQRAQQLLDAWRLPLASVPLDDDARAFRDWAHDFDRRLRERSWTTLGRATNFLIDWIAAGQGHLPRHVYVHGIQPVPPQLAALLATLSGVGVEVQVVQPAATPGRSVRVEFDTRAQEIETAARWVTAMLTGAPADALALPVGLIVPDLDEHHDTVARALDENLLAAGLLDGDRSAYRIAVNRPLSQTPVVRDALACLRLNARAIAVADIEQWLRSPYTGAATPELGVRAQASATVRELTEPELSLLNLLKALHQRYASGRMTAQLDAFYQILDGCPARQEATDWALVFSRQLRALGWPGDSVLDDAELAAVRRFEGLLDELASLSVLLPPVSVEQALTRLRRLATSAALPAGPPEAAVVVLTPEASPGFEFSRLWVTGLHDAAWPRPPRPNPFIPAALQRSHALPRANAAWELEFATRQTAAWQCSTEEVVFSSTATDGDRSLRPSALIAGIAPVSADTLELSSQRTRYQLALESGVAPQSVVDEQAPALSAAASVGGGVGVIRSQAACPFQAFARYRLQARGIGNTGLGLDPSARGSLLHEALDGVWAELGDQQKLLQSSDEDVDAIVRRAVASALQKLRQNWPQTLRGRFEQMETERQVALIHDWLEVDKQRSAFSVVSAEDDTDALIGGLPMTIRPDRLDQVDDGVVVVDYKTGKASVSDWLDERIDEPQLPIYCTAIDAAGGAMVDGVAFALVNRDECKYQGLSEHDGLAAGIKTVASSRSPRAREHPSWAALKTAWGERLEALASAFVGGDARVQPKRPATCQYCEFPALCRIHERVLNFGDEE